VDPYYLTHRARKRAITPIILSGRRISDNVGKRIARECLRHLLKSGTSPGRVTILGLTFKENVPDIWNSRVVDIVRELQSFGIEVQIYDPHVALGEARHEYGSDDQRSRLARPSRRGLFGGGARIFSCQRLAFRRQPTQGRSRAGDGCQSTTGAIGEACRNHPVAALALASTHDCVPVSGGPPVGFDFMRQVQGQVMVQVFPAGEYRDQRSSMQSHDESFHHTDRHSADRQRPGGP
jgi:hypothetical protein